jgi:hypothetical protein
VRRVIDHRWDPANELGFDCKCSEEPLSHATLWKKLCGGSVGDGPQQGKNGNRAVSRMVALWASHGQGCMRVTVEGHLMKGVPVWRWT